MKQAFARLYILLAILLCGGSFAWADEVTFRVGIATNYHMKSNEGATRNGITVTAADAPNNVNAWTNSYAGIQKGGSVTVTPVNAIITKIIFQSTNTYVKEWTSDIAGEIITIDVYDKNKDKDIHTVTWTGSTTSAITLTNISSGQAHITGITVTYTPIPSLNSYGYATFSSQNEMKVLAGATAYTGTVDEEAKTITWNAIADGIIPANEGVLLKRTASSTVTLTESYTSKANIDGNKLIANITEKTKAELGNYIYVLSGSEIVRLSETGKLKANRAYFSMETDLTASGATMRMIWNDAAATIIDVANTAANSNICYNLNGQRVNVKGVKRNAKGIVIVNGKKVIQ